MEAKSQSEPDEITLSEHDSTAPLSLSEASLDALEDLNAETTRISVKYTRDGRVRLRSSQYVGAVSLPNGPLIRILPKAAGTNFLYLLRYAHGVSADTIDRETSATSGVSFVDALAALFVAELDTVLRRGPSKEYKRVAETESQMRGQIDLPRQVQRQGPIATDFEVNYDTLTTDTITNRAIYQAARRLTSLVADEGLSSTLHRQQQQLRRWVSEQPVRPAAVARIETTRLNAHYDTLLSLAEQILRSSYLEDFSAADFASYGLLVNMNTIFEKVVERAARDAVAHRSGWDVARQSRIEPVVTGGTPSVNMYPDFVILEDGDVRLVGDAKWKTHSIRQSDIYQMTSYQLSNEVPGVLVYPEHIDTETVTTEYQVHAAECKLDFFVRELPTAKSGSFDDFTDGLQDHIHETITELV